MQTLKLQHLIYENMLAKLNDFKTLTSKNRLMEINPKLTTKQLELAKVESEIEKLMEVLTSAGATMASYVNNKIEELDAQRQHILQTIANLTLDSIPIAQIDAISDYMDDWDNVSFEDKQKVVDYLLNRVYATSDSLEIEWKI